MRFTIFFSLIGSLLFYVDLGINNPPYMVEICDNGLDDDGDGWIDFNDEDCDCPIAEPISLIPNPSFEDQICCPETFSRLICAETWIQASRATTDYIHLCDFMGWDSLEVPLPLPDGEGCIGYRDGRPGRNGEEPNPNWKEYTGACLTSPLRAGVNYRFEFYVGFVNPTNSPPTTITFFGTRDCEFLPFGNSSEEFGCPTNDPNWVMLGAVGVADNNGWVKTKIDIKPDQDIKAIAIGPDCIERPREQISLYYFFDNLVLAEKSTFEFTIQPISGHPCQDDYTLGVPQEDTLSYQWYKDGIALIGETKSNLNHTRGSGNYQTLLIGPSSCKMTNKYFFKPPVFNETVSRVFCENDYYTFNGQELKAPGTYLDTLKTMNNCDSIVQLELTMESGQPEFRNIKISKGETYKVGINGFQKPGDYNVKLKSSNGCDSTIILRLEHFNYFIPNAFSPNGDGFNDQFLVFGNEDIERIAQISVVDRWGNLVYEEKDVFPNQTDRAWEGTFKGRLSPNGVYIYMANIIFSDGEERKFSGSVALMR